MFACKRTSQKGFSLVELMVVVAIIGVLASIAVPQVNKFIAKSRQSEAKTNLATYYTAQKAFQAEYGVFDPRFGAIGFSPEGQLRYNVGLSGGVNATAANGYNGTVAGAGISIATLGYCGANGAFQNNCTLLNGAGNSAPPAITAAAQTAIAFTARASGTIYSQSGTAPLDSWTINQQKQVVNTSNGIP